MPDSADQSWEQIGQLDAYYGVLTYDQFAQENLNQASRDVFFQSGRGTLPRVMKSFMDISLRISHLSEH